MNPIPVRFAKLVPPGFKLSLDEELEDCPYNPSHYCLKQKAPTHVENCRQAYISAHTTKEHGVDLFACRYFQSHLVPAIEIPWHQERCLFRTLPEDVLAPRPLPSEIDSAPDNNSESVERSVNLNDLSVPQLEQILAEYKWRGWEDWDLESALLKKTHKPFDPMVKVIETSVPWLPSGLTKGARKEFRKMHHEVANFERGGTSLSEPFVTPTTPKRRRRVNFSELDVTY